MILITGGRDQGKKAYAAELLGCGIAELTDGNICDLTDISGKKCITGYHMLIRRLLDMGEDPEEYTKCLCREAPDTVIVMDEIGCGIIPLERSERIWREAVGRCGCIIADNSAAVVRMVCGIADVIKGEL